FESWMKNENYSATFWRLWPIAHRKRYAELRVNSGTFALRKEFGLQRNLFAIWRVSWVTHKHFSPADNTGLNHCHRWMMKLLVFIKCLRRLLIILRPALPYLKGSQKSVCCRDRFRTR